MRDILLFWVAVARESAQETLSIFHEHHLSHPKNHGTVGSQASSLQDFGNRQLVVCKHHPKALRFKSKQESNIQLLLRASLVWKWAGNVRKPVIPTRCPVLPFSSPAGSSFAHGALLTGLCSVLLHLNRPETTKLLQAINPGTSCTLTGMWGQFGMQQDIPPALSLSPAVTHAGLSCRFLSRASLETEGPSQPLWELGVGSHPTRDLVLKQPLFLPCPHPGQVPAPGAQPGGTTLQCPCWEQFWWRIGSFLGNDQGIRSQGSDVCLGLNPCIC